MGEGDPVVGERIWWLTAADLGGGWGVVGGGAGEGVGGRANGSISNIQDGALLLPLRTK